MPKRLVAKVGTYEKDGQTKGRYIEIGVIMSNSNGEYVLLDPSVNLAGILIQQRLMDPQKAGGRVMVSVFDNDRQQGQDRQQQSGGGYGGGDDLDGDSIPF